MNIVETTSLGGHTKFLLRMAAAHVLRSLHVHRPSMLTKSGSTLANSGELEANLARLALSYLLAEVGRYRPKLGQVLANRGRHRRPARENRETNAASTLPSDFEALSDRLARGLRGGEEFCEYQMDEGNSRPIA